ncbi:MAG: hypothetical protein KGH69_05155 [Candidatus Micrarchaeota archaeon]|nr:hypothetical protein [Candidatus Micrarchaeota archaeon]
MREDMANSTTSARYGAPLVLTRNYTNITNVFGSASQAARSFAELFKEESRGRRVNLNQLESNLYVITKLASVMALHQFDERAAAAIPETASSILFFNRQTAYATLKGSRQASSNGKVRDLISYLNSSATGFVVAAKEGMHSKGMHDLSARFNDMIMEFAIYPKDKELGKEIARILHEHGGMNNSTVAYEILKEPMRLGSIVDRLLTGEEDPLAHLLSVGILSRVYGIGNANRAAMKIASTAALYGFSTEQMKFMLSTLVEKLVHSSHDMADRARLADTYISLAHNGFFVAALRVTAAHDAALSVKLHRHLVSFPSQDDAIERAALVCDLARQGRFGDISELLSSNGAWMLLRH